MSLSDVYNRIVGSLTASNNSLPDQEASTYTSITTSSSSAALQNQQIVNQLNAQQQQLVHQLAQLNQRAGYFNYQSLSSTPFVTTSGASYSDLNIDDFDFSKSPNDKKKKDKEMLVNILKSKLQDAK